MSRHPRDESDGDFTALLALTIAGLFAAVAGIAWLAGHLALLLAGHGWGQAPFRGAPRFLAALVHGSRVDDAWRHAYPHPPTPALAPAAAPAPALFWTITATIAILLAVGAGLALTTWHAHAETTKGTPARWARRRHEHRLAVAADPTRRRWRIVAGKGGATGRLLAGHDCVSAVVFGPNGSGKTTSLIVPNVLDWDGPVVMTTAKPHDLEPVCTARRQSGPVWVVAPGGAPGHRCAG
ncbi:MAG: type IV secretory system conjugative DNA transfer family protein, partial [Acidimicrobiaceae bacterium]|nr:type IV secretory system conjugative DNA transfer family protein [Acidimicrobiaceae bacterium]